MRLEAPRPTIRSYPILLTVSCIVGLIVASAHGKAADELKIEITADRGQDIGQAFGTLFEASSEVGELTIGAGFANGYGTHYRFDRHELAFFVRLKTPVRPIKVERLPRPNDLCGTYLFARDGQIHSTYGGLKRWDDQRNAWIETTAPGGTQESMRVGHGVLTFGESTVRYDDRTILTPPKRGSYQLFFYANGYLCFYHVDRGQGGYRPYTSDSDGFSKLYACPWQPGEVAVDLAKAIVLTLPVVGETTFAWGVRGGQIVTGSNIGGFYVFENDRWRMMLEPNMKVSYQLYSTMALGDGLVMGQYPTGRLFEFDGQSIADRAGWPPVPPGFSPSAREAQSTAIFGGEVFAGVWPWGELWRFGPSSGKWTFVQRMFDHPEPSVSVVHPYDVENKGDSVPNQWGQRVTSLVTSGPHLYVATSAKNPCEWDEKRAPFLAPEKWKSYGTVYRLTMPGHVSVPAAWTDGPTKFEFVIAGETMSVLQDGRLLGSCKLPEGAAEKLGSIAPATWGDGIYGRFTGPAIEGRTNRR